MAVLFAVWMLVAPVPSRAQSTSTAPSSNVQDNPEPLPSVISDESSVASDKPPPLHLEYVQSGVAIAAEAKLSSGATCAGESSTKPCILGGGGGLVIRGGYRSPGPWYLGGAYEFAKMDSSNLYRLGIFQQLRFEMRYMLDFGRRVTPYGTWGVGALAYGNEWGAETGGALAFGGIGMEVEVSRVALLGLSAVYRPMLIAGWTDTAGQVRDTGVAQFLGLELLLEIRTALGRR